MSDDPFRIRGCAVHSDQSVRNAKSTALEDRCSEPIAVDEIEIYQEPSAMHAALRCLRPTSTSDTTPIRAEPLPEIPSTMRSAFDVFVAAGIEPRVALDLVFRGATPEEAKRALVKLLSSETSLRAFGPKAVAVSVLARIAAGAEVSGREVRAAIEAHRALRIVRPDGYIAMPLSGQAIERAGDVRMTDGKLLAGSLEVGAFYAIDQGLLYPTTMDLERDPKALPFELSLDRMALGRMLDGAESALRTTIVTLGRFVENPARSVAEAVEAFGKMGELIVASPELCDHFLNMPLNDQIEAVSNLAMTLALAKCFTGASARGISVGGSALDGTLSVGINAGRSDIALRMWLNLDLSTVAGAANGTFGSLGALIASPLLSEIGDEAKGTRSTLPELSAKAEASMKRAAKALPKEAAAAKKKALPRIEAAREKLVAKLDKLLANEKLPDRSRAAIESARNAMQAHLTPEDLTGALRDALEMPLRAEGSGEVWQHEREVREAMSALKKAQRSLAYEFQQGAWEGNVVAEVADVADEVLDFRRAVEAFIGPK